MFHDDKLVDIAAEIDARIFADRALCSNASQPDTLDCWFPLLGLPETRRQSAGCWSARATWPADKLIWRDPEAESEYIRQHQEGITGLGEDERDEFILKLDEEAEQEGWRVPWPAEMEHEVFFDHAGECLAEGMAQQSLSPIELVAFAQFPGRATILPISTPRGPGWK